MKVTILGSGVIGVTSAWYLAQAGVEVTVIERQPEPASETSFANAGQVSPGYATPWAAPGIPLKALQWLFQPDAPLRIRPDGTLFQIEWLLQMLINCGARRFAVNKERMLRVAEYSRDCLDELRAATGIDYEGRQLGTTQIFRTDAQVAAAAKDVAVLEKLGIPHERLDPEGVLRVEPGLAVESAGIRGALRLPRDQTGDCRLFTVRLAERAKAAGVRFLFGQEVWAVQRKGGRIESLDVHDQTTQEVWRHPVDQLVVALGSWSRPFLTSIDLSIPVYPLKGYSITVPIADAGRAPVSTIMDETWKVGITRFNDRIRVGGMAEVFGYDLTLRERRRRVLERVVQELYPGAGQVDQASFWTGLRPATPDGTPIIGATPLPNLWLNTGHGTLGWTMSCGSGRILADLITGRAPGIAVQGLSMARYRS